MRKETQFAYPDAAHLRPSLVKTIAMIFVCAFFAIGGVFIVNSGDPKGWICILVFGPGLILGLWSALPGASGLAVTEDGFAIRSLFRTHYYAWGEVSEFGVYILPIGHGRKKMVGFCGPTKMRGAARLSSFISGGFTHSLPDTYGTKAENLAENLNAYRLAAVESSGASGPHKVDEA